MSKLICPNCGADCSAKGRFGPRNLMFVSDNPDLFGGLRNVQRYECTSCGLAASAEQDAFRARKSWDTLCAIFKAGC